MGYVSKLFWPINAFLLPSENTASFIQNVSTLAGQSSLKWWICDSNQHLTALKVKLWKVDF